MIEGGRSVSLGHASTHQLPVNSGTLCAPLTLGVLQWSEAGLRPQTEDFPGTGLHIHPFGP